MIPALGAGGPGFDSPNSPIYFLLLANDVLRFGEEIEVVGVFIIDQECRIARLCIRAPVSYNTCMVTINMYYIRFMNCVAITLTIIIISIACDNITVIRQTIVMTKPFLLVMLFHRLDIQPYI